MLTRFELFLYGSPSGTTIVIDPAKSEFLHPLQCKGYMEITSEAQLHKFLSARQVSSILPHILRADKLAHLRSVKYGLTISINLRSDKV